MLTSIAAFDCVPRPAHAGRVCVAAAPIDSLLPRRHRVWAPPLAASRASCAASARSSQPRAPLP
eukprot:6186509-Pleurochrysis_carterae.AAC.1